MATPESKTKAHAKRILDEEGVYYFMPVTGGYGRSGIGDIVCCVAGLFLMVECKAGKGKPTALQERELQRVSAAGGFVLVLWDTEQDMDTLRYLVRRLKQRREHV